MLKSILFICLVCIIVYQVLKLIFRPLLYFYAGRAKSNPYVRPEESQKEGELKVDFIPPKKSKSPSSGSGEYVDFEEIDS